MINIYLNIIILNDNIFGFLYCNIFVSTTHCVWCLLHVQRPNLTNVRLQVYIVSIIVNICDIILILTCVETVLTKQLGLLVF